MSEIFSYPLIGDWDAHVSGRSPSVLRTNPQWDFTRELAAQLEDIEASTASIVYELDPALAVADRLDKAGARVFEPRGGLDDGEYRRIILAREVAGIAHGTAPGIWVTWLALAGVGSSLASIGRAPGDPDHLPAGAVIPVPPCVVLTAQITATPSIPFVRRAGVVIRDAIAAQYDVSATFLLSRSAVWAGAPGWTSGYWAIGVA